MRIILKPGGALVLLLALGSMATLIWKQQKTQMVRPVVAATVGFQTTKQDANLIRNGDMTDDSTNVAGDWKATWVGYGKLVPGSDAKIFHSAPRALVVDTMGSDSNGQIVSMVPVTAGQKYRVRGFLRAEGTGLFTIATQYYDADEKPVGFEHLAYGDPKGQWIECDREVSVPAHATKMGYLIYVKGTGKTWLDDASVIPIHGN